MRSLIGSLAAVALLAGCAAQAAERPDSSTVVYEVTGDASSADVTLSSPTGSQQAEVDLPMKNKTGSDGLQFRFPVGSSLYVSAQNKDAAGTVTCRIRVNGVVVSENQAVGGYQIATCHGRT